MRFSWLIALVLGAFAVGCADDDFGVDLGPAADFSGIADMAVADSALAPVDLTPTDLASSD